MIGVVFGAMFVAFPTWNAVVSAYRTALVPDHLQGRVVATIHLVIGGTVPLGLLVTGIVLEKAGSVPAVLALSAVMVVVAVAAARSRALRDVPPLGQLEA